LGVFETLLVVDGQPIELDAHVERLANSIGVLFASAAPIDARQLLLDRAGPLRLARLRLTVTPIEGERLRTELTAENLDRALPFPGPDPGPRLGSLVVEGGLGAHKWADRRLLDRAEAMADGAVPLLLDGDGAVLEASRANVFAVRDDILFTPPTDGRIIAGITRNRVLELAQEAGYEAREERLSLDDLSDADEVFLTGSVRGIEPVLAIDGDVPRVRGHYGCSTSGTSKRGVAAELAAALRDCWLGQRQALNLP
jgi:para-aminobenzoate synthetase/4-amino-4-deoxychorismate lyase